MKYLKLSIILCFTTLIASCGTSSPQCSDDVVKNLALDIADDKIGFQLGSQLSIALARNNIELDPKKISYNLNSIRTTDTNKQSKKVTCAGNVQILYGGKAYFEHPVTYTAQRTDDGKSVWVEARFR